MKTLIASRISSLEELRHFVLETQRLLVPRSIVLLSGELGAGKTTLVSCFCNELGIMNVQSPTYAIHNQYSGIDHFDLYRLEGRDEIEASGFFDLLEESKGFCFIEWPERLSPGDLPAGRKVFEIVILLKNGTRDAVLRAIN